MYKDTLAEDIREEDGIQKPCYCRFWNKVVIYVVDTQLCMDTIVASAFD